MLKIKNQCTEHPNYNHLIIALIIIASVIVLFLVADDIEAKEYNFHYNDRGNEYSLTLEAKNWEEAMDIASNMCLDYYSGNIKHKNKIKLEENTALRMVDICTNPK